MNIDNLLASHGLYDVDGVPYQQIKNAVQDAIRITRAFDKQTFDEVFAEVRVSFEKTINQTMFDGVVMGTDYMYQVLDAVAKASNDHDVDYLIKVLKPQTDAALEERRKELGV